MPAESIGHFMVYDYWPRVEAKGPHHFPTTAITYKLMIAEDRKPYAYQAFDDWATTGLTFVETDSNEADILIVDNHGVQTDFTSSMGITLQATASIAANLHPDVGDFALDLYFTHEIGHALGLGHPGTYNAWIGQHNIIFPDDSAQLMSVMSYVDVLQWPGHILPADHAAVHEMYFAQNPRIPIFWRPDNTLIGGWDGGVDTDWYLGENLDVWAAGVNPRQHYEEFGWREGRDPNHYFDNSWYLEAYSDVEAANVNPMEHYNSFGWREGRDPGPLFDTEAYLTANPDVAAAGVNPLQHFMEFGLKEGRPAWIAE